jgi:hypothetical protein
MEKWKAAEHTAIFDQRRSSAKRPTLQQKFQKHEKQFKTIIVDVLHCCFSCRQWEGEGAWLSMDFWKNSENRLRFFWSERLCVGRLWWKESQFLLVLPSRSLNSIRNFDWFQPVGRCKCWWRQLGMWSLVSVLDPSSQCASFWIEHRPNFRGNFFYIRIDL